MVTTWAVVTIAAAGFWPLVQHDAEAVQTYQTETLVFRIPCRVQALSADVVSVELWASGDRGGKWTKSGELVRGGDPFFEFRAPRPGEYWFAPRMRYKDGTAAPAGLGELVPQIKVVTRSGPEPKARTDRFADTVKKLDDELTRVELELIAKEIKALAAEEGLNDQAAVKIKALRSRLLEVLVRTAGSADEPLPGPSPVVPPAADVPLLPMSDQPSVPRVSSPPLFPPVPDLPPVPRLSPNSRP